MGSPVPEPEGREGTVALKGVEWTWTAVPAPREEDQGVGDGAPAFMDWYDFVFRRKDDPDQEARGRGGLLKGDWSEENVREVLRACRARTWRDSAGILWDVRRSGPAPASGVSPETSDDPPDAPDRVVTFRRVGSDRVGSDQAELLRRETEEPVSLTEARDPELEELLEG